jgi:hypothetical protein
LAVQCKQGALAQDRLKREEATLATSPFSHSYSKQVWSRFQTLTRQAQAQSSTNQPQSATAVSTRLQHPSVRHAPLTVTPCGMTAVMPQNVTASACDDQHHLPQHHTDTQWMCDAAQSMHSIQHSQRRQLTWASGASTFTAPSAIRARENMHHAQQQL